MKFKQSHDLFWISFVVIWGLTFALLFIVSAHKVTAQVYTPPLVDNTTDAYYVNIQNSFYYDETMHDTCTTYFGENAFSIVLTVIALDSDIELRNQILIAETNPEGAFDYEIDINGDLFLNHPFIYGDTDNGFLGRWVCTAEFNHGVPSYNQVMRMSVLNSTEWILLGTWGLPFENISRFSSSTPTTTPTTTPAIEIDTSSFKAGMYVFFFLFMLYIGFKMTIWYK